MNVKLIQFSRRIMPHDDALAFTPSAIELERKPSSFTGRSIMLVIMLLFIVALCWAYWGRVDIVAVAQGKVIPSQLVKTIQSLERAKIKSIYVREGQYVEEGQLLLQLDDALLRSDLQRYDVQLADLDQNIQRLNALLKFLNEQSSSSHSLAPPSFSTADFGPVALNPLQTKQLEHEENEINSALDNFDNTAQDVRYEKRLVTVEIVKKQQVLPVLQERVDALDTMQRKSYGSKLSYLELQQLLIEEQQDLLFQQARLEQLNHNALRVKTDRRLYLADRHRTLLTELNSLSVQRAALSEDVSKLKKRISNYQIRSPIEGRVQELVATTTQGVVQGAGTLMLVVPSNGGLEIEAKIMNRDIGFVWEGQRAEVKIDTFNFTKYGAISAHLSQLSEDAVQDEHLGLIYKARFKLNAETVMVDGSHTRLSPGMSVTAEIKTGQRRLIEFFMSPLLRYQHEGLRER